MTTRALTSEEVQLLDNALLGRRRFRERAFLWFSLGTGFRVSETLSLQWGQVLQPCGAIATCVTVERALMKGGSGGRRGRIRSRRVPLSERVRCALADYLVSLQEVPRGPVFRSRIGDHQSIRRGQAYRQLKALAEDVGIAADRIGTHSCRKYFAARVHKAGGFDLVKTQRLMGHSSPLVTVAYLETSTQELDSLVLGLEHGFEGEGVPLQTAPTGSSGSAS
jgi:integrase